jgi:hypothetical protein
MIAQFYVQGVNPMNISPELEVLLVISLLVVIAAVRIELTVERIKITLAGYLRVVGDRLLPRRKP